jgi:hypothetical protein
MYKDGVFFAQGYSGFGEGLNNPSLEHIPNVGPLPKGLYDIGIAYDSDHGPITMRLTPKHNTNTYGRAGFLIHGDLKAKPGKHLASHGCIIHLKSDRDTINKSVDKELEVVL